MSYLCSFKGSPGEASVSGDRRALHTLWEMDEEESFASFFRVELKKGRLLRVGGSSATSREPPALVYWRSRVLCFPSSCEGVGMHVRPH